MTINCKQVMHQDELSLSDTTGSDESSLGLVTVDCTTKLYGYGDLYTFLHLTFQEYLAAVHISQLSLEELFKVIDSFGDKDFMRVVWKFYCGLTQFDEKIHSFNQIITSRSRDNLFKIQCAFESQQGVTCESVLKNERDGCFSFRNCSMTALDFTAIGYVIKNAETHSVKTLVFDNCTFGEDDVVALTKEAGNNIFSVKCLHLSVHWGYFEAAYTLLNSLNFLQKINLIGTTFTSKALEPGTKPSLPNLKTLVLEESQCKLESLKIVRELFGNSFKCLEILQFPVAYLRNNIFKVFGLELLIHSISHHQHILGLQGLELNYESAEILSADLKTSLCTKLVLTNCSIDDRGAKALARGIICAIKLKTLNLSINKIRDEGAIALAESFKYCTNLSMLDLSCNDIGDDGAIAVAEVVTSFNRLVDLHIWNSRISELGINRLKKIKSDVDIKLLELEDNALINEYSLIKELAEMPSVLHCCKSLKIRAHGNSMQAIVKSLENCNNLQTLKLVILDICSFDDGKLFAGSLRYCKNLISLDLEGIRINVEGAWAFVESLSCLMKLQTLSLGDSNFKNIGFFELHCNQLKSLDLARNQIGDDGTGALASIALKSFVNLQSLNLSGNKICLEGAKSLATVLFHFKGLQSLDLSDNNIGSGGIKALANALLSLTILTILNLSGNSLCSDSVGVEALTTVLTHCSSNLQVLHLSDNHITESGIALLSKALRSCTELKTLDLGDNIINDVGAESLADSLQHCSNLQILDLSHNCLSSEGVNTLTKSIKFCMIQTLDLNGNCIDHFGARALADALQNCLTLQTFRLGDNSIGDDGAMALVDGLKICYQLKVLDISYNGLTASGVRNLANGLRNYSKLELLNLGGNSIGYSGVSALSANLKHHEDLITLDLERNVIGDDGAKVLAEGLRNNLQNLNLSYNNIGEDGAKALAEGVKCTCNLQILNLSGNRINDDGTKALAESVKYISGLQELDLSCNYIAHHGAIALAGEIKHCSNLQAINFRNNVISWDGAKAFADVAIYNSNPLTLDLGYNCIYDEYDKDDSCINNLATSLRQSKQLRKLALSGFRLGSDTLASLKHCSYLQELNLDYIDFIEDFPHDIAAPVDCLKYCKNLQILSLCGIDLYNEEWSRDLADYLKKCGINLNKLDLSEMSGDSIEILSGGLMYCSNLRVFLLGSGYNYDMDNCDTEVLANSLNHCGSIQELHLTCRMNADSAKALVDGLKCCDLKVFDLHCNEIGNNGETFHGLRHYINLRELNLNGNSIGADSATVLADSLMHCSNLVKLDLTHNRIGADGAETLADGLKFCFKLEELCISGNEVGDRGTRSLSDSLKHLIILKILDFSDNRIGADGAKCLADTLKNCIKLHTLDLKGNGIDSDGVKVLVDSLEQCVRLQILKISGNNIDSDCIGTLGFYLKHHSNLLTLDLGRSNNNNMIGSDDAKVLSDGLKYRIFLKTLDLSYNKIGTDFVKALSDGIKSCSYLEDLVLGHNIIDGYGAEALSDCIKQCCYLQKLDLGYNKIDGNGVRALSDGLKHCCYLHELDLGHNAIDDEGAKALSDCIKHCFYLQILNLGYNSIGADGAKALSDAIKCNVNNLNSLNLCGNSISDHDARVLTCDIEDIICLYD